MSLITAEMWGNHCEYVYTNRHYGNGGSAANEFNVIMQGNNWYNAGSTVPGSNQIPTLNCYLAAIESFNPNSNADYPWIPKGLPYDLFDGRNDNVTTSLNDGVIGYTYQQSFNSLQSDVRSIPTFRDRFLQLNGNSQQSQVITLFNGYNY